MRSFPPVPRFGWASVCFTSPSESKGAVNCVICHDGLWLECASAVSAWTDCTCLSPRRSRPLCPPLHGAPIGPDRRGPATVKRRRRPSDRARLWAHQNPPGKSKALECGQMWSNPKCCQFRWTLDFRASEAPFRPRRPGHVPGRGPARPGSPCLRRSGRSGLLLDQCLPAPHGPAWWPVAPGCPAGSVIAKQPIRVITYSTRTCRAA